MGTHVLDSSKAGLTLVEVMIASALGVFLISGIYSGIIQSQRATYAASQYVAAFNTCREELEEMRGSDYDYINTAHFGTTTNIMTHLGGSKRIPITCVRSCIINHATNPERKQITVTATWSFHNETLTQSVYGVIYKK